MYSSSNKAAKQEKNNNNNKNLYLYTWMQRRLVRKQVEGGQMLLIIAQITEQNS